MLWSLYFYILSKFMCTDSIYKKKRGLLRVEHRQKFHVFVFSPVHTDTLRLVVPQLPEYLKLFCSANKENEKTKLSAEHQTANTDFLFFGSQSTVSIPVAVMFFACLMLYSSSIYSFIFFLVLEFRMNMRVCVSVVSKAAENDATQF